ncbi:hypothetical protein [Streptodolium elevatio]|uniref:Uncharacterized protein n=1 Tax=Streptodolium elevatio TaxID=3157996 RepID=A0ABV3DBU6_9ACTN
MNLGTSTHAQRSIPEYFTSHDGLITLRIDTEAFDACIDARPGYKSTVMAVMIRIAERLGLEPLDEDECEPEILEDGTIRIYCALINGGTSLEGLPVWS